MKNREAGKGFPPGGRRISDRKKYYDNHEKTFNKNIEEALKEDDRMGTIINNIESNENIGEGDI